MGRGRPVFSQIRENIAEILFFKDRCHGYEIYSTYIAIYPKVSQRSIYYQLKRGEALGMFRVERVVEEEGRFSWGTTAKKRYYTLGRYAKPVGDERVRRYIDSLKLSEKAE